MIIASFEYENFQKDSNFKNVLCSFKYSERNHDNAKLLISSIVNISVHSHLPLSL